MTMKSSLFAVLLALSAVTAVAANSEYKNEAGEQDLHQPQVADAGHSFQQDDQSYPQLG
jgi:uncharacterized membrane protein